MNTQAKKPPSLNIIDCIGNTPLFCLTRFNPKLKANLYAKCEMFNPTLSIKDRIVFSMIRHYENTGQLTTGATIYESSSGNTGCSLAMIGALFGYPVIITVPEKTSKEKITVMQAYGATVIVCKKSVSTHSPEHYINKARILSKNHSGSLYFNQYDSQENVNAHYRSTAVEIWQQMSGEIDYIIIPASSGGTITGIGKFLKEKNSQIKVILPDPIGSVFYDYFHGNKLQPHNYQIEGAGKDTITSIHDFSIIDDVIQFSDEEALNASKKLALTEGLLAGGSSGGALVVAEKLIENFLGNNKPNVVVVLPDSGLKYLSKIF